MTEPQTEAGKALLGREDYNSRSFALITVKRILAIEAESRNATLDEVVRVVEPLLTFHFEYRAAVLDAVKALRG